MIHYDLRCEAEHVFDGWFRDIAAFERQAKHGLVECPMCGSARVSRALMAPAIGAAAKRKGRPDPAPPVPTKTAVGPKVPAAVIAQLQRLRAEIEANCDYVGPAFAEEARAIAAGESERTGIFGETTQEEAAALRDEGIEIAAIPWVPRADG